MSPCSKRCAEAYPVLHQRGPPLQSRRLLIGVAAQTRQGQGQGPRQVQVQVQDAGACFRGKTKRGGKRIDNESNFWRKARMPRRPWRTHLAASTEYLQGCQPWSATATATAHMLCAKVCVPGCAALPRATVRRPRALPSFPAPVPSSYCTGLQASSNKALEYLPVCPGWHQQCTMLVIPSRPGSQGPDCQIAYSWVHGARIGTERGTEPA